MTATHAASVAPAQPRSLANQSPLWPAQLDHLQRNSDRPETLVAFYRDALGLAVREVGPALWLLEGLQRRVLIGGGTRGEQPLSVFRVQSRPQLEGLRAWLTGRGIALLPLSTPLFAEGFAVRDPDGRLAGFGLPKAEALAAPGAGPLGYGAAQLPGRLQHVVVATTDLPRLIRFYRDDLGFIASDDVYDGEPGQGPVTATFLRSDPEHHSFAAFRAPEVRPDHHSYETTCWNDIRDWADHMASLNVKLWWGPGRHGPGNNLFFMVEDPDGHKVELSAEIERLPRDMAARSWKHEERTLNLWGQAWMRS
jgi:catechol 2,3-dioxygenase-like lactoylglutathione lyase family enzyme